MIGLVASAVLALALLAMTSAEPNRWRAYALIGVVVVAVVVVRLNERVEGYNKGAQDATCIFVDALVAKNHLDPSDAPDYC